ncbi:MAG: hypothetical protein KIT72_06355 [Polyangiaceae bacterium]|nr:hypothetical protein [Polyangiaceae bacterium]MCW5790023.1 hypothetical protein [Polyangiaceae bacterium]
MGRAEKQPANATPRLRAAFDSEPRISTRPVEAARRAPHAVEPESDELTDVPAAVTEIPGPDDYTLGSGVVVIVPWERPFPSNARHGFWGRLWATSRLATESGRTFFARFPDGDVSAAVRFSIAAELVAVSGTLLVLSPLAWLLRGAWDLSTLPRVIAAAVPMLAVLLATLHAAYGLSLDWAARRGGATGRTGLALRYGLYTSGWDVATSPLGLLAVLLGDGRAKAWALLRGLPRLPASSAVAFLCGSYGLSTEAAWRATRAAGSLMSLVTLSLGAAALTLVLLTR